MILPSQLNEPVCIQQQSTTEDGYGGVTVTWVTLATVFAQVTPLLTTVNQRVIADQLQSNAGYRVVIRLRTDITSAMRIVWKTHTLLIHSLHETDTTLTMLTYEEQV